MEVGVSLGRARLSKGCREASSVRIGVTKVEDGREMALL